MTLLIIPSRPTTRPHAFVGVTGGGREVSLSVTAVVDITESAVLADLRASMPGISALRVKDASAPGLLGIMFIMFMLWLLFAFVVAFICLLVGGAGFIDFHERWAEYLPIIGGERIGKGLFRAWVAAIPVVAIVFPLVLWAFGRKDLEAMKVGR